jgi:hypothetical protein
MKTKQNWAALLQQLKKKSPDGFTAWEFADEHGCSVPKARQEIGLLIREGVLQFAGNRSVIRIDGRAGVNPVYAQKK